MNKIIAALTLAFTTVTVSAKAGDESPTSTVAAFHAALAKGDANRALSLLAKDAVIYEAGHVERSRDEYAHHHLAGDINFAKTTAVKMLKQTERATQDMAVIWQETETTGTVGGRRVHLLGTATSVLEKRDGRWTIVHLHWSSRKPK